MRAVDGSAEGAELRKLCRLNLASCYLRNGDNLLVISVCNEVLGGEYEQPTIILISAVI